MNLLNFVKEGWIELFKKNNIIDDIKNVLNKIKNYDIVYPPKEKIFKVFELIDPLDVKVVIIGQDPYHNFNQANGIAFSVNDEVKTPPSLRNIFKELKNDLNIDHFQKNDLTNWVLEGVLLVNSSLTVEKNKPNSHKNLEWDRIIIKILNELNNVNTNIIYCLWGNNAKKIYNSLVKKNENSVVGSAHPSPFSYKKGFENSKPFSKINEMLILINKKPINWNR